MRYGERCEKCSGEDCPCCEVYQEWKADQRAAADRDPFEEQDALDGDRDVEDEPDEDEDGTDDPDDMDESMDGDHASALASAGFGTDEDYEHNDISDFDFGVDDMDTD